MPFVLSLLFAVLLPLTVVAQPPQQAWQYSSGRGLSGFAIKMEPDSTFQTSSWDCLGTTVGKGYYSVERETVTFYYKDQSLESSFTQIDTLQLGGDSLRLTIQLFDTGIYGGLFPANLLTYDQNGNMIWGESFLVPITEVVIPASRLSSVARIVLETTGYESVELQVRRPGSYEILVGFVPAEGFIKYVEKQTKTYRLQSWTEKKIVLESPSGSKLKLERK